MLSSSIALNFAHVLYIEIVPKKISSIGPIHGINQVQGDGIPYYDLRGSSITCNVICSRFS